MIPRFVTISSHGPPFWRRRENRVVRPLKRSVLLGRIAAALVLLLVAVVPSPRESGVPPEFLLLSRLTTLRTDGSAKK